MRKVRTARKVRKIEEIEFVMCSGMLIYCLFIKLNYMLCYIVCCIFYDACFMLHVACYMLKISFRVLYKIVMLYYQAKKKKSVVPVTQAKKSGSVGRNFFLVYTIFGITIFICVKTLTNIHSYCTFLLYGNLIFNLGLHNTEGGPISYFSIHPGASLVPSPFEKVLFSNIFILNLKNNKKKGLGRHFDEKKDGSVGLPEPRIFFFGLKESTASNTQKLRHD